MSTKKRTNSQKKKAAEETNPDFNLVSIGNYMIQKTLGEGNFAKVKLAKHKMTGQEVIRNIHCRWLSKSLIKHNWMKRN